MKKHFLTIADHDGVKFYDLHWFCSFN